MVSDCGGVLVILDDPLALLSLGIWLFAAGMWPVGFLFATCSPCCGVTCPYRPEFNRCIRWRKKVPDPADLGDPERFSPPEQRVRGFSQRTRRPEDIGAFLVNSRLSVMPVIRILPEARRLSDGEAVSETIQLRHANGNPYGPPISLSIEGVTVPLIEPPSNSWSGTTSRISAASTLFGASTFPTPLAGGLPAAGAWTANASANPHVQESVNTAISAEVIDAYVARELTHNVVDGDLFTREYLKSLVSVSLSRPTSTSSAVRLSLTWTPPAEGSLWYAASSSFTDSAEVRYVIRASRGAKDTYFSVVFRMLGQGHALFLGGSLGTATALPYGETSTRNYTLPRRAGVLNANATAEVFDAYPVVGGEFINASREELVSLASVEFISSSSVRLTWSGGAALQYAPALPGSVVVNVVFRVQNGDQRWVYFTVPASAEGGGVGLPANFTPSGIAPLSVPQNDVPFPVRPPAAPVVAVPGNTPVPPTAPTFSELEVSVPSHAVPAGPVGSTTGGLLVEASRFDYSPEGADLVSGFSSTNSNGIPPSLYWRVESSTSRDVKEVRYALRLRMTSSSVPWAFIFQNQQTTSATIYDLDVVEDFLSGESELTGEFTQFEGFNFGSGLPIPSEEWTAAVSEANPLCELALCHSGGFGTRSSQVLDVSPVARSGTFTRAAMPETYVVFDEKGPQTRTNYCFGSDDPAEKYPLYLGNWDCNYSVAAAHSCKNLANAFCPPAPESQFAQSQSQWCVAGSSVGIVAIIGDGTSNTQLGLPTTITLGSFYAGDLLWTLENGPAATSVTTRGGTFAIEEESPPMDRYCPPPSPAPGVMVPFGANVTGFVDGVSMAMANTDVPCWPREVTVAMPSRTVFTGPTFSDGFACINNQTAGYPTFPGGDYILSLTRRGCGGALWASPNITLSNGVSTAVNAQVFRPNWCDEPDTFAVFLSNGVFHATVTWEGQPPPATSESMQTHPARCSNAFTWGGQTQHFLWPPASAVGISVSFDFEEPAQADFSPEPDSAMINSASVDGGQSGGPVSFLRSVWGSFASGDTTVSAVWGGVRSQERSLAFFPPRAYSLDSTLLFGAGSQFFGGYIALNHPIIPPEIFAAYSRPAELPISGYDDCVLDAGGSPSDRNGVFFVYQNTTREVTAGADLGVTPAFGASAFAVPPQAACFLIVPGQASAVDTRTLCGLDSVEVLPDPATGQPPSWVSNVGFLDEDSSDKTRRVVRFDVPPRVAIAGPSNTTGAFTIRIRSGDSLRDIPFVRS